jgi:hypothetical protein
VVNAPDIRQAAAIGDHQPLGVYLGVYSFLARNTRAGESMMNF